VAERPKLGHTIGCGWSIVALYCLLGSDRECCSERQYQQKRVELKDPINTKDFIDERYSGPSH
jgi:hypothetical protein